MELNRPTAGTDFFPSFSVGEFERRHERVRAAMAARGLDALLVHGFHHYSGNDMGQTNVVWLANFANVVHTYVVVPLDAQPTLVVGLGFHVPVARKVSVIEDVRADAGLIGAAIGRLRELGLGRGSRVGVVGYYQGLTLPVEHHRAVEKALPDVVLEDVTGWLMDLRLVKSAEEGDLLRRAGALSDHVHESVFAAMRVGAERSAICRIVGIESLGRGGSWALSHVGASSMQDPADFYPDFYATDEKLGRGDFCQTEFAIGYGNYFVKTTATSFVGEPPAEYRRLFEVASEVQNRCIDGLRPGMTGRDANRFLEPLQAAGLSMSQPLIGGFSTYNTDPWAGAIPGTPLEALTRRFDDFVFEPGHCLFVIGTPHLPRTRKGLWVGQTCLMTETGLERLTAYPVDRIRIVGSEE